LKAERRRRRSGLWTCGRTSGSKPCTPPRFGVCIFRTGRSPSNGMKREYSPHEIKSVLQALSRTKGVIIGGQAVNLWAEHCQKESAPWKDLRPYTSFDLEVLGDRTDVLKFSQALKAEPFFPTPSENAANSWKIVTQVQGAEFEIDFLHSPNGLSPAEVMELARPISFEQIPLKILHPMHCVESKTVNLMTLPTR
jgi:hypothetical protein